MFVKKKKVGSPVVLLKKRGDGGRGKI